MHTFRLLDMAEEIGRTGEIIVRRPNREFLLKIRAGAFEYADLVVMAEERIAKMDDIYERSNLPETPDLEKINESLVRVRKEFYESTSP